MTEDQLRESVRLEIEERKRRAGGQVVPGDIAALFDGLDFDRETVHDIVEDELSDSETWH